MGTYVIVMPLHRLAVGDGFARSQWPLHVTVVGNFRTDADPSEVAAIIAATVVRHTPLEAVVGAEAWFGPDADISVNVIDEPSALAAFQAVHRDLLTALSRLTGFTLETPEHADSGYRPHITATAEGRAAAGDCIEVDQIALVNMTPDGPDRLLRVLAAATKERTG